MPSFAEAFARLASLTNYERKLPDQPYRFDLESMDRLCADLGHPERRLGRVAQVAGSKGKGTVTTFVAAMGRATGLRVGAYLSPHVESVRERILLDGEVASEETLSGPLWRVIEHLRPQQTWFEAFTAAALLVFAGADVEMSVLEVGLGGRLDSTTVVPKDACCITGIELEHTEVLGDTIAAIATEKAGILRPGVPCVTGASGEALAVVADRAKAVGAPLLVLGRELQLAIIERTAAGLVLRVDLPRSGSVTLVTPLQATVQARSLALALALFAETFPERIGPLLTRDPRTWIVVPPGRFQVLSREPPVVVDGAHTDDALAALAEDLAAVFPGHRFHLVFAIAKGKRWRRGLGRLLALVDRVWVARLEGKPGEDAELLRSFVAAAGVPCQAMASVATAVAAAMDSLTGAGLVVTGSLYAAGDALRVLRAGDTAM